MYIGMKIAQLICRIGEELMKKIIIILSMMCVAFLSAAAFEHYQDSGFGVELSLRAVRETPFSAEIREPGDEEFPRLR